MSDSNEWEHGHELEDDIAPLRGPSRMATGNFEDDVDTEWLRFNILSLDGGGIRGYWTLLALEKLMEYIAIEEMKEDTHHSFAPQAWPKNVSQIPLTGEERSRVDSTYDEEAEYLQIASNRRFLPCHYFDYICGSSTGALIAIMLGRFRMTVPDCIFEYKSLGQEVFGKPRFFYALRFGVGDRTKYKAAKLERVFKEVTKRRSEQLSENFGRITFPSGRGLCSTFVTTMELEADSRSSSLYLIRSYDHDRRNSPDHSRRPTPRTTMRPSRANTGISAEHSIRKREKTLRKTNYGKAQEFEIWQVARAATAAQFYFEPLKIESSRTTGHIIFTDGGFSHTNNPTKEGLREIEDLHGDTAIGIVVSVGTARKTKEEKGKTFWSTVPKSARDFADTATNPEIIHEGMQQDHNKNAESPYYRLNHPGGLQTELDEWEPKQNLFHKNGGSKTMENITHSFNDWAAKPDNIQQLQNCAIALVACRRKRMFTEKWERYATGARYQCRFRGCDLGDFYNRSQFGAHLTLHHEVPEGRDLEEEERHCRKHWRYQAPGSANAISKSKKHS